jgi:putative ABC transport system permease protein
MFKIAIKSTLARKGRLVLTALAVIAGCTFLSGVFVFTDTIQGSFNRLFANAYAGTDAFVRSSNVIEGEFGLDSRDRLPDALIDQVKAIPGVADAVGDVQAFARLATVDGKSLGQDGPPKYGGVFVGNEGSPWRLASGKPAQGATEVVIDRASAKKGKLAVGDKIQVTSKTGVQTFTIAGIATFAGSDTSGGATWALFDLPTAEQFLVGTPGKVDSIEVRGDGSASDATLKERIASSLQADKVQVLTGAEITKENQDAIQRGLSFFTIFLTIFAAISLFVGSFIIFNVFSISAAQRQRENALLRAIGARRSQVTRVLFIEAITVGAFGGLIGFGGGVGLATLIIKILTALGIGPSDTSLQINASAFAKTFVVGVVVTVLCAIVPAIRSGRVPPLAAMRDVSVDRSGVSRGRLVTGLAFLGLAILGTALGLVSSAGWLGLGIASLFAVIVVLGPLFAAPLARAITKPLGAIAGVTGQIAGRNAATSPKRTAVTASAFGIGLALLIGVSALGSSIKTSIREAVGEQFTGDFAISTDDNNGFGGLPVKLADDVNALPQVQVAAGYGQNLIKLVESGQAKPKLVLTLDPAHARDLLKLSFTAGGWDGLNGSSILVSKSKADREGITIGSTEQAVLQDGSTRALTVAGIFDSKNFGNLIVSRDLFTGQQTDVFDTQVLVSLKPGVSIAEAETAIKAVAKAYPTAKVQTRDGFIADQSAQIDQFLNFVYALLGMSIFIALLGVVITLLLAIYERRRELGLVRAVGMTRFQVATSTLWEAIVTALLGVVIGVVLGVSLGWIVVRALKDQGLSTFSVSAPSIAVFCVMGLVFTAIFAVYPSWKASRADILDAIATT